MNPLNLSPRPPSKSTPIPQTKPSEPGLVPSKVNPLPEPEQALQAPPEVSPTPSVRCLNSSMIHSFEYNEKDQTLRVYFRGGQIYDYFFIPKDLADNFTLVCQNPSESSGKWFGQNIRKTYEYHKVA